MTGYGEVPVTIVVGAFEYLLPVKKGIKGVLDTSGRTKMWAMFVNSVPSYLDVVRSESSRLVDYLAALGALAIFEVHVVALKLEGRGWPPPASRKKSSVKKTRRSPERPTRAA